jgi:hypothetical protein
MAGGQRIEEGGFADVGKTYDPDLHGCFLTALEATISSLRLGHGVRLLYHKTGASRSGWRRDSRGPKDLGARCPKDPRRDS